MSFFSFPQIIYQIQIEPYNLNDSTYIVKVKTDGRFFGLIGGDWNVIGEEVCMGFTVNTVPKVFKTIQEAEDWVTTTISQSIDITVCRPD